MKSLQRQQQILYETILSRLPSALDNLPLATEVTLGEPQELPALPERPLHGSSAPTAELQGGEGGRGVLE